MINVVLCGGNGTRLWPLSRTLYPKQFNKLISNQSLFQMTVLRNRMVCNQTFVVSNEEQYFLALDHLEEVGTAADYFILEPIGRNTAPAIALAALAADEEELILVTPSDHIINKKDNYIHSINNAKELAEQDYLVTFGISPEYPETGYGYIESNGFEVISFKEKPNHTLAEEYIRRGNFFWNSGIFLFKAKVFLKELEQHAPDIYENSVIAFNNAKINQNIIRIVENDMLNIPSNSIDFALMENSGNVRVIPSDIGWSDLGSFESLYAELPKDEDNNAIADNYIGVSSHNNLIMGEERLIATIDVDDLVIIDTSDALLITKQGSSQKVKSVVEQLKIKGSNLCDTHITAYRPWGNHTVLDNALNYKIKKVIIKPGKKIRMQKHFHRNEHWVVIQGTALVSVNGEKSLLRTNESTFIRVGDEHYVENPGLIDLYLIEVQVGEYISEEDVVR